VTSKELVLASLKGEKPERIPSGVHSWGMYKFALQGIISDYAEEQTVWNTTGMERADVESAFQERFQPDYMHLSEALFESKKRIIHKPEHTQLLEAVHRLDSKQDIDELTAIMYHTPDQLLSEKIFDHLPILSERHGDEVFIFLHTESPVHDLFDEDGVLGFQRGMTGLYDHSEMIIYLLEKMHQGQLDFVRAVKIAGAHGYAQSEAYMSADLVSPDMYRKILLPVHREFYREAALIGIEPIMCFWGDINPLIEDIGSTGISGLMIEESRKNFTLDAGKIRQRLPAEIGLFGNVSAEKTLLYKSKNEVRAEVRMQIEQAGAQGGFINCTGTPIAPGTPTENVLAAIDEGKVYDG
jgi:uroporphyrinogen-III decarboxylase